MIHKFLYDDLQVLGHVHYLPAAWRGRAHTKDVAAHFQDLFQFRAVIYYK